MKPKHTPGPWVVAIGTLGGPNIVASLGMATVASLRTFAGVRAGGPVDPQTMANAELIAAAPAMYEALANLENDADQMPAHAWENVQQALAMARGGHR